MEPISRLSTVHVHSFIEGAAGTEQVKIAFTAPDAEPGEGDWHEGEWGNPTPRGCPARILVGPDGVELGVGMWAMWVQVIGAVEKPVFRAGLVPVI